MSLLQTQTTNLLGIGSGSIQDFAAGVRSRRKGPKGLTREESLAQATANEGQDARLQQTGDITPTHDPKTVNPGSVKLTVDDKAFIERVQQIGAFLQSGLGGGRPGKSDTRNFRANWADTLTLAENSSRGGLADIWSDVYNTLSAPATGKRFVGGEFGALDTAYRKAVQATNRVLDTSVDTKSYKFEAGRAADQRQNSYKGTSMYTGTQSKTAGAKATNFWENPLSIDSLLRKRKSNPLGIG